MSLLEILIGSLLFLLTTSLSLTTLHHQNRSLVLSAEQVTIEEDLITAQSWIDELFELGDSSTLPWVIRLYNSGGMRYTDGSPLTLSTRLRQKDTTTAISALGVDLQRQYKVLDLSEENGKTIFLGCPRYSSDFAIGTEQQSFLGGTSDGFIELFGKSYKHMGRSDCRDFSVELVRSVVVPDNPYTSIKHVRTIIPITENGTLYLTNGDILRYLRIRGGEIIENQPLVHNIEFLSISSGDIFGGDHKVYTITLKHTDSQRIRTFQKTHSLLRATHHNLLFH